MSTKIPSGYSASSEKAEICKKHSDFSWTCARHLTEAGTLLSGHALGNSECFSLKMYLIICRSFGSVVSSCNMAAAWGHVLTVTYLAE